MTPSAAQQQRQLPLKQLLQPQSVQVASLEQVGQLAGWQYRAHASFTSLLTSDTLVSHGCHLCRPVDGYQDLLQAIVGCGLPADAACQLRKSQCSWHNTASRARSIILGYSGPMCAQSAF
jgi:hypothetical protein